MSLFGPSTICKVCGGNLNFVAPVCSCDEGFVSTEHDPAKVEPILDVRTVGDGLHPLDNPSIFLAGPIERKLEGHATQLPAWRDRALRLLRQMSPGDLCIYTPEWAEHPNGWTYDLQVQWEVDALHRAKVILCWIPRRIPLLPGFTTNVEVGEWLHSKKLVVGAPQDAPHTNYIKTRRRFLTLPWHTTLESCCSDAITLALGSWEVC